MKHLCFAAAAVFATGSLFAGVKIVSENTDLATKKVTTDTIMLDANRMRLETDNGTVVMFLTDGGRNRMVMLNKEKKTYQEIDEQTMKQMAEQMSGMTAQMEAAMKAMMGAHTDTSKTCMTKEKLDRSNILDPGDPDMACKQTFGVNTRTTLDGRPGGAMVAARREAVP